MPTIRTPEECSARGARESSESPDTDRPTSTTLRYQTDIGSLRTGSSLIIPLSQRCSSSQPRWLLEAYSLRGGARLRLASQRRVFGGKTVSCLERGEGSWADKG